MSRSAHSCPGRGVLSFTRRNVRGRPQRMVLARRARRLPLLRRTTSSPSADPEGRVPRLPRLRPTHADRRTSRWTQRGATPVASLTPRGKPTGQDRPPAHVARAAVAASLGEPDPGHLDGTGWLTGGQEMRDCSAVAVPEAIARVALFPLADLPELPVGHPFRRVTIAGV